MTSRPVFGRVATGAVTVALAAGLGSAVSTAAADTADTAAPSPTNTKMSLQQAIGCGGNASYFWCR
ncbi:hypothetical protein [Corynebacterium nuruki]|uniref:Uncharacterized protein n=1 Tax=Corynebacterium nuruki TaxID=1032851 RepID=A0A3D4SWU8_9CORY|nr:hypothetical protein [Corynebacterium nuruki]HCT13759.1 hypothetical protein [Corynebacterium nuruki]